jgi:putative metallopeptidase DUF4344
MSPMKCPVGAAALLIAIASPAIAQAPPPDLFNPQIEVEYAAPRRAEFVPIYERLKARKALDLFRQFLAPLKLTEQQKLVLRVDECNGAMYARRAPQSRAVTICYEFVEAIERLAPTRPVELVQTRGHPPVRRDSALVGPFAQAVLHEVALAAFDLFEIPVWGRKDDAADRVAALIMLQFSEFDMAWTAVVGTAWFLAGSTITAADFADVRGTMAQRYYTTLCIAYGAAPKTFGGFVAETLPRNAAAGDLPASRASSCPDEYATLQQAVHETIGPHLEPALVQRVQGIKWLAQGGPQ